MKKVFAILSVMLVAVLLLSACKKEDERDKFVGTYKVIEKEAGYLDEEYNITITKSSSNTTDIVISGVFTWLQPNISCTGTVNGSSVTIPTQTYAGIVSFSGSGNLYGVNLSLGMLLTYDGGSHSVSITGNKM